MGGVEVEVAVRWLEYRTHDVIHLFFGFRFAEMFQELACYGDCQDLLETALFLNFGVTEWDAYELGCADNAAERRVAAVTLAKLMHLYVQYI
jgi:hypothetical protein